MQQPINANSLRTLLDEAGLSAYADVLVPLLKPAIAITSHRVENEQEIPIGASKLGGSPDLPPEFRWPEHDDRKLVFVAQINLKDAKPLDPEGFLPDDGILYFFYDDLWWIESSSDRSANYGHTLHYRGATDALLRTERGTDISDGEAYPVSPYAPCSLTFSRQNILPNKGELDLKLSIDASHEYRVLRDRIIKAPRQSKGYHRMFGYPETIQGSVFVDAEINIQEALVGKWDYEEASQHWHEWLLLMQIDTDHNADMDFGDWGTLYYCIKRDALQQADFEQVSLVFQCY